MKMKLAMCFPIDKTMFNFFQNYLGLMIKNSW